jgi:hypothetical protein
MPGRLSRAYHSQEEGLEINLRGYRPTIFVLHRGRWGTGEFRRQPFRVLEVFLQKDLALQTKPIIGDSIVAHLFLQLLHKIHNSALTSAQRNRENTDLERSEWEVHISRAKHG